jgi:hypothetical protein
MNVELEGVPCGVRTFSDSRGPLLFKGTIFTTMIVGAPSVGFFCRFRALPRSNALSPLPDSPPAAAHDTQ